jgi:hypothetical protein
MAEKGRPARIYPKTPDGRYFIVRGRLWRLNNPAREPELRRELVADLMSCRRSLRAAASNATRGGMVRENIDALKRALAELRPVWWTDGAPDYNRYKVKNTPYQDWYATNLS